MLWPRRRIPLLVAVALVAALLSGCASTGSPASLDASASASTASVADTLSIRGVVVDEQIAPISGATLTLLESNVTTQSDAGGTFSFPPQGSKLYTVVAEADGYAGATLIARPGETQLEFVLSIDRAAIGPFNTTVSFNGHFDCAAEYLIIPGDCGIILSEVGQPDPFFANESTFFLDTEPDWRTIIVDVAFEGQPTFDGLRVTLRGQSDAASVGTYEQYGRFHGSESYTFRIEPGQSYPDGAGPMPENATKFKMEVYPQGYGWHALPIPLLGVGAGQNIEFQIIATVFYVESAPADFSRLS
ncbi:MAG: carboxypeptidase-like regulatory domain-containing protein [Candidatus Thermoplasmatota archaeon]